jgi:hypothetical protein
LRRGREEGVGRGSEIAAGIGEQEEEKKKTPDVYNRKHRLRFFEENLPQSIMKDTIINCTSEESFGFFEEMVDTNTCSEALDRTNPSNYSICHSKSIDSGAIQI